ncbi:MAG: hypothetical protein LKJ47_04990 [Bifidobacteriaceae bacterium]|jgi:DNA-binding Lrp family transcriptional regulator|nr:hypothetical protein [Bifidobacteriaceae bacterium]
MKEHSYTLVAQSIDELRKTALANEQTKTKLSETLNISRPTLNARFNDGDMKLTEFVELAVAVGKKPSKVIERCDALVSSADSEAKK